MSATAYTICGSRGEKLYPAPSEDARKFRPRRPLYRDIKRAITERDHAELVEDCTRLACSIPVLGGALRQMSEWAFAGDSWQPIHFGGAGPEWEAWGESAADWLLHTVYPNCVRKTTNKSLVKAMQVSAKAWLVQGDDLALFSVGADGLPKLTIVPGTAIGNGNPKNGWWSSATLTGSAASMLNPSGYGICVGGRWDGFRIYNGIIFDDSDEPIAARVLGWKKAADGKSFVETYADFQLGFQYGAHLASPYDWHGMGRSVPRLSSAVKAWRNFCETDENFSFGIKLAATKTVIHQLAEGQDAVTARGDDAQPIETTDADGNAQTIYVSATESGDVTYIGSGEQLAGMEYEHPHPNAEEFAVRKLRENIADLGWLFELIDLSNTGRAPTRLACDLANNSIWQLQMPGDERMTWFVRYAIGVGIANNFLPAPPAGPMDAPYQWTFGYPKEISVDQGNDVTASLNRLRYGLTSQRIESARWGHVLKRIERDREKEVLSLLRRVKAAHDESEKLSLGLSAREIMQLFWQPSQNAGSFGAQPSSSEPTNNRPPAGNRNNATANGHIPESRLQLT